MEFETTLNNGLAKLLMLKLGEYEMWEIRIKQYLQILDYALWEVVENGNSWVSVPVIATPESGPSTTKMTVPATTEEKTCKKNNVKAIGLLLMALPNEHQLTFNQYEDAKTMFEGIKARFGGNEATKKTQKALLKQQYENFNASSSESLDSIFNRLQKLVSRLAVLGVATSPEDLNVKFLRSLPAEWDTHVVVWMNKPDFETIGLDDLYNNFKIIEQKIKKTSAASSGDKNLAFVTASGSSSTNIINTANPEVSTASTKAITASTEISPASLSDATVYAFISSQPRGSQLVHEDLEQLHDDDLEEMDLKWNLALLSMRERKFYQRTGRMINYEGSDIAGFDKSRVECYNFHKLGHFSRECRSPRNPASNSRNNGWNRNQGSSTKTVKIEDTSEKAMMAIDGVGFDWSEMAEEQVQINMALMAFSDSEVYTKKSCSKTCLKNHESLKKQCDDLIVKLNDSQFKTVTYKRSLATLEDQIVAYKRNEVLFSKEVAIFKREVGCKEYELGVLRSKLEKVKQEKDGIDFKIKKFDKSTKDLEEMIESQRTDKNKQGLGYNVVAPPHPLTYNRPTQLDMSYSGLDEFKQPEVNMYGLRESVPKSTNNYDKKSENSEENTDDSLKQHKVEKQHVSESENSSTESPLKFDKDWKEKFFHPAGKVDTIKSNHSEKLVKRTVRYAEMYRSPRGNQRNWNGKKSNQLGDEFVMQNKSCFKCGGFDHMKLNCPYQQKEREVSRNNYNRVDFDYYAKSNAHRHMTPRAVLLRNGLKPLNTARPFNTAQPKLTINYARPKPRVANTSRYRVFNTGGYRAVNTARPFVNTARVNGFNAVKPSACWVWRPTKPNGASLGNPQKDDKGFVDSGCSRHMTDNIAYLSNFKEFDGALSSPKQTAIGKDYLNPFMADSLPKTISYCEEKKIENCPKKTSWEQFSSNIATAIICLATGRKYNFSKLIFEHMVTNISSPHKFLMYPRFIQLCLDTQRKQLKTHTKTYHVPSLNAKVFNNMKRPTKGYTRVEVELFLAMLHVPTPESSPVPSSSPSRITSSPSHSTEPSPEPTSTAAPTTTEPQPTQSSPRAEEHVPTPHDSPLHAVHLHESEEGSLQLLELTNLVTKLSSRIKVLSKVKIGKARRRTRIVLSEEEDSLDDSSKQGRKMSHIEDDSNIFQDEGVEWIQQEDVEVQGKISNDIEPVIQDTNPTKVFEEKESAERGQPEVSTAGVPVSTTGTASVILTVSTASIVRREIRSTAGRIVYSRRSMEKKDKGKAIMTEPELEPKKKSKKEIEQEILSLAEAITLQEQLDEEQRAQIGRDEEIARQWEEQERIRAKTEAKSKEIDWSHPSNQGKYKIKDFEGMSYDQIRPIFERTWKFNQDFLAEDSHEVQKEDVAVEKEEEEEEEEKPKHVVSKKPGGKRRKLLAKKRTRDAQDKEISKRQKHDEGEEDDEEDEDINQYMVIVPVEEIAISAIPLSTRPPVIVDVEIVSEG
ncbi:ribonuclease H-like domain-containing protein [Tanacetum coccineum]